MPLGNGAVIPRNRAGHRVLIKLWLFGVLLGGGLLFFTTFSQHATHKDSWQEHDQALLRSYAGPLLEVHEAFAEQAEAKNPMRFLTGYVSVEEISGELRRAYQGALDGGWLDARGHLDAALIWHYLGEENPLEILERGISSTNSGWEVYDQVARKLLRNEPVTAAETEWLERSNEESDWWSRYLLRLASDAAPELKPESPDWYERYLRLGTIGYGIWISTLLFAPFAIRSLLRPQSRGWRITTTWLPVLGLTYAFWAMLAIHGVETVLSEFVAGVFPFLWQGPVYHLTGNLFYLLIQAGPVLLIALLWLPTGRSFRRVFGLEIDHLFNRKNLGIVLGLYGLYGFLGWGFYEVEKLMGTCDTRDFLDPLLIDSGILGLLSQIVLAAVIAPIFEEMLFRGFLFTSLRSRWPVWVAALVSSLVFAAMHFYSWPGLATIVIFGLVMCWLYQQTRSLWPGILFHAMMNFQITVSSWYLYSEDFSWLGYLGW